MKHLKTYENHTNQFVPGDILIVDNGDVKNLLMFIKNINAYKFGEPLTYVYEIGSISKTINNVDYASFVINSRDVIMRGVKTKFIRRPNQEEMLLIKEKLITLTEKYYIKLVQDTSGTKLKLLEYPDLQEQIIKYNLDKNNIKYIIWLFENVNIDKDIYNKYSYIIDNVELGLL